MTVEIHADLIRTGTTWSGTEHREEKPVVAKGATREEADNALTMMAATYRHTLTMEGFADAKAWAEIVPPRPMRTPELDMDALREGILATVTAWGKEQPLAAYDIYADGDAIVARLHPRWGGRVEITVPPPIQRWDYPQ